MDSQNQNEICSLCEGIKNCNGCPVKLCTGVTVQRFNHISILAPCEDGYVTKRAAVVNGTALLWDANLPMTQERAAEIFQRLSPLFPGLSAVYFGDSGYTKSPDNEWADWVEMCLWDRSYSYNGDAFVAYVDGVAL